MSGDNRLGAGEPSVLRSIARHWLLIVLVALAIGVLGVVVMSLRAATYLAEAGVLLEDPRSSTLLADLSARDEDRYVADQISILRSPALLARVSELTVTDQDPDAIPIKKLQRSTSIRTTEGSNYIVVRFHSEDPAAAMQGANLIVRAYRELVQADLEAKANAALKRIDAAIAEVTQAIASSAGADPADRVLLQQLRTQRSRLEVDAQLAGDGVALFSPAAPGRRQGASLFATIAIALVLGALVGVAVAYLLDARELRVGRRIGSRRRLRVPALAEIPDFRSEGLTSLLPALDAPGTRSADAFRFLAAAVGLRRTPLTEPVSAKLADALQDEIPGMTGRELAMLDLVAQRLDKIEQESQKPSSRKSSTKRDLMIRSVAFVGASEGDGTTTLAANTAMAAAQAGDRVLMLDGDLWGRGLTQFLLGEPAEEAVGAANGRRVGLTDMLLRGPLPEGISLVTETENGGTLSLIEPGATTLEAMNAIRTELIRPGLDATREDFDRVFIDVPPILDLPYANALVTSCDAVVVVLAHDGDPDVQEALFDLLDRLRVRPIGRVVNFAPAERSSGRVVASDVRAGAGKLASLVSLVSGRMRSRTPSTAAERKPRHEDVAEDAL